MSFPVFFCGNFFSIILKDIFCKIVYILETVGWHIWDIVWRESKIQKRDFVLHIISSIERKEVFVVSSVRLWLPHSLQHKIEIKIRESVRTDQIQTTNSGNVFEGNIWKLHNILRNVNFGGVIDKGRQPKSNFSRRFRLLEASKNPQITTSSQQ